MPLEGSDAYELDESSHSASQTPERGARYSSESEHSDIDVLGHLDSQKDYSDDASRPLQPLISKTTKSLPNGKPLAWLERQRRRGGWRRWCLPSRFCCLLVLLFFATLFLLMVVGAVWVYFQGDPPHGQSPPWYPSPRGGSVDSWQDSYRKAKELVERMTLVEKVNMTTGTGWSMDMCVGNTGAVERVGFPSLCLQDGPLGLRFVDNITAFPAGITVGATWNKELMKARGRAQGLEARLKGINVLLGPAVGPLGRLPAGGRNWEGFGADPVLQGIAAAHTVQGIQDSGVMATIKHFVGNEQEHYRQSWEWGTPNAISSNIDDRTLHEIYAWPFMDAIKAGVASVMCSYNQVNNSYACQNSKLINGLLKDEFGFQGFVQSDWLAQRSGVASALAGLDMTMPGDGLRWQDGKTLWGSQLTKSVLNSSVPMDRLNDMALRIAAAWYQLGQDDVDKWPLPKDGGGPNFSSWTNDEVASLHPGSSDAKHETGVVNKYVPVRQTDEGGDHDALAESIAVEGIVLVKNDEGVLPLSRNGTAKNGRRNERSKIGIFGEDAFANPKGPNACPDRSCNEGTLASGWGSGAVEFPHLVSPAVALQRELDLSNYEVSDVRNNNAAHAAAVAKDQDLCIVFINSDSGEGYESWNGVKGDRNDLLPQKAGDQLVKKVAATCGGHTVVVLHTVGPTLLESWIDAVKGVLIAHLPGQESGNALVRVLFGDVNPSGRLPYTIARSEEDYGPNSKVLYHPNGVVPQQNFTEGIYFDYRYLDKHSIEPRFEFGYGKSYTQFKLSSVLVRPHPGGLGAGPPKGRPDGLKLPTVNGAEPSPDDSLWPKGLRRLKGYIYPWIEDLHEIKTGHYPYPDGYQTPHAVSPAGGGQGGNPDLYTTAVTVQATLSNIGTVPGDCVVQLYVSYPDNVNDADGQTIEMPIKVLRNFEKYYVGVTTQDKRKKVEMTLTRRDLSYWDVKQQNWILPKGKFIIRLGFSSRDLPRDAQSSVTAA